MELKINVNYKQMLRLIHQLPKKEIKKLADTLQSEISSDIKAETLQKLILQAPTWTDDDFTDYDQARVHMNKSRIA